MIQPHEIRIGNWLWDDLDAKPFQVEGIAKDKEGYTGWFLYTTFGSTILDTDEYPLIKPIPLTPEVLKKAGFKYVNTHYEIGDFAVYFSLRNGLMLDAFYRRTTNESNIKGCKYIHQLQNLYFSLTGEELIINL